MAEILFITPEEIKQTTILGGNVDKDKFLPCVHDVQIKVIEELLGTELYDKLITDLDNDTLTGDYLTMFENYIKPITKFEACADYIGISNYSLTNKGVIKSTGQDKEIADIKEVQYLAKIYHNKADMHIGRFNKWMDLNYKNIPEYKTRQDEVNAKENINLKPTWYFPS